MKLAEAFTDPTLKYGLSTIFLRVKDNDDLNAQQNTIGLMMLGLQSGKVERIEKLREEILIKNLVSKV